MKKLLPAIIVALTMISFSTVAYAATTTKTTTKATQNKTITGLVTATSTSKITFKDSAKTSYTVNIAKIKIEKIVGTKKSVIKVKDVKIGDTITVTGKVNKNIITATIVQLKNNEKKKATVAVKSTEKKIATTSKNILKPARPEIASSTDKMKKPVDDNMLMGNVTSIKDSTLIINTIDRSTRATITYTITLNDATKYFKNKVTAGTKSDLTIGKMIAITGVIDSAKHTATATRIKINTNDSKGMPPRDMNGQKPADLPKDLQQ